MYGECVNGDSQVFCVDLRKALSSRIVSEIMKKKEKCVSNNLVDAFAHKRKLT